MTRSFLVAVGAVVALIGGSSLAATNACAGAVFADGTLEDADWTTTIISQTGPTPTAVASQVASGGNPDTFRRVNHTFGGNGSVVSAHMAVAAIHDPASDGPIDTIDISFDLSLFFGGTSNAVGYGVLLFQNGNYFAGPTVNALSPGWSPYADFDLSSGDFNRIGGSGSMHPDFSLGGGSIQFGYFAANGSSLSVGTSTSSGLDNWTLVVHVDDSTTTTTSTTSTSTTTTTSSTTTTSTSSTSTTTTTLAVGLCGQAPQAGCAQASSGTLLVNEKVAGKEKLVLKLKGFDADTLQADFGDPVEGDTFASVCVYDDADGLAADLLVDRAADDCASKPCWKARGSKGYLYKDRAVASSGVAQLGFLSGASGKGVANVLGKNQQAKGMDSLPTGIAPALSGSRAPTAQLLTSEGLCLSVVLTKVAKDQAGKFLAKR